ncbi:MAG: hypothetical protein Q7J32_03215 [Sphingomonadaceae bacterium]|nr:hypothetical protein [Sphingomonadaceae bacterium]
MNSRKLLCLATTGLIGACAPMEQAPLVYTSKVLVGAHVEAGTPENPGLAINLGIKGLDAAFVPVAVAKWCANGQNCQEKIYERQMVVGTSEEAIDPALKERLASLATRIGQIQNDTKREQDQLNDLTALIEAHERAKLRIPELRQTVKSYQTEQDSAAPEMVTQVAENLAKAKKSLEEAEALQLPVNSDKRLQQHRDEIARLAIELTSAKAQQVDAQLAREVARKDTKNDAFSVYGSFDGNAAGDKDSAGLSLGKVFSTGIAAQNLTQGIREAAHSSSKAACISAVDDAVARAKKANQHDLAAALEQRKPNCLL